MRPGEARNWHDLVVLDRHVEGLFAVEEGGGEGVGTAYEEPGTRPRRLG